MASAILVGGFVLAVVLAALMLRPGWRLPALALAILAIPGNVDNLMPQMTLDPNAVANATGPAVSVVDLLIGWAVLLTWRERPVLGRVGRTVVAAATIVAVMAGVVAVLAALRGIDPLASLRGAIVFARIPALVGVGVALRGQLRDPTPLALGILAGGVGLLGNGIYHTVTTDADRFTATTFGRNGFAIALILVTIVGAGLAFSRWHTARRQAVASLLAAAGIGLAVAGLFGAVATGTRMALIILLVAGAAAIVLHPAGLSRGAVARAGLVAVLAALTIGSAVVFTSAGGRTLSIVTDPGDAVEIVTDPGEVPDYSAVRSRTEFWQLAVRMAREHPLTGVGPFQWNVQRYVLDPGGQRVVADPHNSYLQIAAEYGLAVLVAYLALLGSIAVWVGLTLLVRARRAAIGWTGVAIAIAALVYPVAELTNSHLFNVRLGAFGWLLLGTATALAIVAREALAAAPVGDVRAAAPVGDVPAAAPPGEAGRVPETDRP